MTLRGSAVDLGVGIDGTSLEYNLDGTGYIAIDPFTGTSWEVPDVNLGVTQGAKTLLVRGSDKLGNEFTTSEITFYYDVAPPTVIEDLLNTTDTQFSKEDTITLSGTLSDSNEVAAADGVTISVTKDGAAVTPAPIVSYTVAGDNKSATWSSTPAIDADGLYIFTISGNDIAGKTHVIQRTVRRDTVIPEVFPEALSGWKSGDFTLSGTSSDTGGSSLDKVEYRIVDFEDTEIESWSEVSGTASWSVTIDTSTLDETILAEGHEIEFRAYDKAGNVSSTVSRTLNFDKSDPRATIEIDGTANEENGIDRRNAGFTPIRFCR